MNCAEARALAPFTRLNSLLRFSKRSAGSRESVQRGRLPDRRLRADAPVPPGPGSARSLAQPRYAEPNAAGGASHDLAPHGAIIGVCHGVSHSQCERKRRHELFRSREAPCAFIAFHRPRLVTS
jgi:hypothetical protein